MSQQNNNVQQSMEFEESRERESIVGGKQIIDTFECIDAFIND